MSSLAMSRLKNECRDNIFLSNLIPERMFCQEILHQNRDKILPPAFWVSTGEKIR